jgi:DNA replication protein DnaC
MAHANIPAGYWMLNFNNYNETSKIQTLVKEYIGVLQENYYNGKSICFVGTPGTGKTMSGTFILRAAIKAGFSAYYLTASDMLNEIINSKDDIRTTIKTVDFLMIDELDSRFFYSDASRELFSGIYENIFRHRTHNALPTIICSNETGSIMNVFSGACVQNIESLNNQYLITYPIVGIDYRKRKE